MRHRSLIGVFALATALGMAVAAARAHDEAKFPDWKGQWIRLPPSGGQWDPAAGPRPAGTVHDGIPGHLRGRRGE
jgi:hypothetical protein